ncbi:TPA: hypothetical protein HA270_02440 [Candidatus Woesearchaeota archaeon]|nr:hypothetical protein [Candidatus Woesearchaeota archaeon]
MGDTMVHSETPLYQCAQCKKEVSSELLKYSRDGKRLICLDCHTKIEKAMALTSQPAWSSHTREDRIKWACSCCGYHFTMKKGTSVALRCPYCGSRQIERDSHSAQDILDSV